MKKYLTTKISFIVFIAILIFSGCETLDLEVKESPNALNPNSADIDLFLNSAQLGLTNFITGVEGSGFKGMSEFGMEPVRMLHGFGPTYRDLYQPGDFTQAWRNAYSGTLIDLKTMTPLAIERGLYTHVAIGQIIESYIMLTLVDFFGDVPYSEISLGADNLNPKFDSGAEIYEAVDNLLIDAISNLNKDETSSPTSDLYFGNGDNDDKWIKVANTLRLKLHLQTRKANETSFNQATSTSVINTLIAEGNLILTADDDFQFQYSTNLAAPDSRHPYFDKNYDGTGPSAGFYMTNYYMNLLANRYTLPDPRTRYYFYRQVSGFNGANVQRKPCVTQPAPNWYGPNDIYCTVPNTNGFGGLWGRNHLDADGIPPDDQYRTLLGVYPIGGPFDDNDFRNVSGSNVLNEGKAGAGITPILLSSFTNFMLAEAALELGTSGTPLTYLEKGINQSIEKVMGFGASVAGTSSNIPSGAEITTYINDVRDDYNNNDKLKVIVEQYFIALWTNGIEAYNTYRRTGYPDNLTPSVDVSDPGVFVRSNWYPSNAVDRNSSKSQKDGVSTPVFWDTNPEGFVN